jgi:hypothetical protein
VRRGASRPRMTLLQECQRLWIRSGTGGPFVARRLRVKGAAARVCAGMATSRSAWLPGSTGRRRCCSGRGCRSTARPLPPVAPPRRAARGRGSRGWLAGAPLRGAPLRGGRGRRRARCNGRASP